MPEVKRELEVMMVVSTVHITQSESDYLNAEIERRETGSALLIIDPFEYGWMICLLDPGEKVSYDDFATVPPNVQRLLDLGRQLKCQWIRLDQDGPVYPDLPEFDW